MNQNGLKKVQEKDNQAWAALQDVRKAEEQARLKVEEARQKTSLEIIRTATEKAEELKKKIIDEARRQADNLKQEIISRAQAEAQTISQQTSAEKQEINKKAQANFDLAVEKAAEKLISMVKTGKD
jgi:vacuolar-type H+-ATPase subunit H